MNSGMAETTTSVVANTSTIASNSSALEKQYPTTAAITTQYKFGIIAGTILPGLLLELTEGGLRETTEFISGDRILAI